ncbi:hypothetical protein R1sor_013396 [Riccia sorocarpa]|uniref:Uncharacterized protein n=1 Tax=Riccia sorocarpa TaxID=122646 RepID=A0ABD3H9A9_9MARC
MPAGLMVKAETKTLDILKSGRKWEVSLYPLVFDCNDSLTGWKEGVPSVPCAFCRGMISPGTDLRIPDYGHSYHVSCIVWIPTMRLQKKKYLDSLHQELSDKTCAFIRSFKQAKGTRGETTCHNRALVTVAIDVPRGDDALHMLCKINMALCIRLRPWDGIFLEHFAQALLVMPWALDILNTLVEKQLVTVWRTGHIPLQVLQSKDSYKTNASYDALKPLWTVSKVWECDDPSHSRVITPDTETEDSDHYCRPPPTLPSDLPFWLATGAYSSSLPSSSGLSCTDQG